MAELSMKRRSKSRRLPAAYSTEPQKFSVRFLLAKIDLDPVTGPALDVASLISNVELPVSAARFLPLGLLQVTLWEDTELTVMVHRI
jgi:hypothetical protein